MVNGQALDELAHRAAEYGNMREHGPRPTLGELQQATPWVWLWCERCQHHAPLACAVAVILWGPDACSDKLRAGARFTNCGNKGATLQHPGWVSSRFQTASGSNCLPSSGRRQHVVASLLHDVKFTKKPLILAFNRLKLSFEFRSSV